jgi:ion channel POLLUX/CASTOR
MVCYERARMRKITLGDRLRYAFDNTMSRGAGALIAWLFLASAALVLVVTTFVVVVGVAPAEKDGPPLGFAGVAWMSFMRTLDAGTMGGDSGSPVFLGAMLAATMGGVFVVSALIGILTNGLEAKITELRKGRSMVVEQGHTLVLGWSSQVMSIVSELAIANQNQKRSTVVILADRDKVEMEDEIRAKVGDTGRMRVVCRTGDPIDQADLSIGSPDTAKSIIVIGSEGGDPDSQVIKTVLALTNNPKRRREPYHIVTQIRDARNLAPARMVGKDEAKIVLASELISRITVQTCRQSGLSVVFTDLLDFDGDEIYFADVPGLAGKTFGEALHMFDDSALIGLRFRDGTTKLNPPMDTRIEAGDIAIAIAEDDDAIRLSKGKPSIQKSLIREGHPEPAEAEHTLILGWNRRAPEIIKELEAYVAEGSEVLVVADHAGAGEVLAAECGALVRQKVTFELGDIADRRTLDRLGVDRFRHIITLSYSDDLGPQEADAKTLVTLLHLRDIEEKRGESYSIVSEMVDPKNQKLAEVTQADDFIVSDRLVSLALTQISENAHLGPVFDDLFDADGAELYIKKASDYVALGEAVTFHTVLEAARRRGEVAVGYKLKEHSDDAGKSYGVVLNPRKADKVALHEHDGVIVLALG